MESSYSPRLCNTFKAFGCYFGGSSSLLVLLSHFNNACKPFGNHVYVYNTLEHLVNTNYYLQQVAPTHGHYLSPTTILLCLQTTTFKSLLSSYCYLLATTFLWQTLVYYSKATTQYALLSTLYKIIGVCPQIFDSVIRDQLEPHPCLLRAPNQK